MLTTDNQTEKETRTRWNKQEWLDIAEYLYLNHPEETEGTTMLRVTTAMLNHAQDMVMRPERRRLGFKPLGKIRQKLSEVMVEIRTKHKEKKPEATQSQFKTNDDFDERTIAAAEYEAWERMQQGLPSLPENTSSKQFLQQVLQKPLDQANALNAMHNLTLETLVEFLTDKVATKVVDLLEQRNKGVDIKQVVTTQQPAIDNICKDVGNTVKSLSELNKLIPKPKKPQIAIAGPISKEVEFLIRDYKEFEIICVKEHATAATVKEMFRKADRVLYMRRNKTSFDVALHAARSIPKSKCTFIEGGISAIRRQLNIWQHCYTDDPEFFLNKESA